MSLIGRSVCVILWGVFAGLAVWEKNWVGAGVWGGLVVVALPWEFVFDFVAWRTRWHARRDVLRRRGRIKAAWRRVLAIARVTPEPTDGLTYRRVDEVSFENRVDAEQMDRDVWNARNCLACRHVRLIHAQGMDAEPNPICLVVGCECQHFVGCSSPNFRPISVVQTGHVNQICITCGEDETAHPPHQRLARTVENIEDPREPRLPRRVREEPKEAERETVPPSVKDPTPPKPLRGRRINLENS